MKRITWSLVGAVLLGALGAGGSPAAPFAVPRSPTRPFIAPRRLPTGDPDCAAAPLLTLALGDSLSRDGDTSGATNNVDLYGCVGWDESGPESVLALSVDTALMLHVRLLSGPADLDLFLLSGCSADSCVAWASGEFVVSLTPRATPWYLVVDGYRGDAGPYTLQMATYATGPTPDVCDTTGVSPCSAQPLTLAGNLLDRPDRLVWAPCASYTALGGEQWFALSAPDSAQVTIELSDQTFDGSLWLFDGCGQDAVCLDHADAALAGGSERIVWRNLSGARMTCYVGVDAALPISSTEGATLLDGQFQLQMTCSGGIVANDRPGWGALKNRFR